MPQDRPARYEGSLGDEAWMRLPGETALAYQHFIRYREQEPWLRSIKRLAAEVGRKSPEQLYTWSAQWRWVDRVKAWDTYCEEEGRKAQLSKIRAAAALRVDVVLEGLQVIHDRLVGRFTVDPETGEIDRVVVAPIDPGKLDAKDLAALGNVLSKMQGLAEEAAGVKVDKPLEVEVKLGFDLEQGVVTGQGRMVVEGSAARRELERSPRDVDETELDEPEELSE